MRIKYFEKDGRIGIRYTPSHEKTLELLEDDCDIECFDRDVGLVPVDIQRQGQESIQKYATQVCGRDLKKMESASRRKAREWLKKTHNVDFPLLVCHKDSTVLRGRIVNAPSDIKIVVKLEEPYQLCTNSYIDPTCFASSMAGRRTFEKDGSLTEWAIQDAEETLVALYEKEKCRRKSGSVVDLVDKLNKGDE